MLEMEHGSLGPTPSGVLLTPASQLDDVSLVPLQIAAFPKENGSRPRIVVFTQGKDATVVATHGKV